MDITSSVVLDDVSGNLGITASSSSSAGGADCIAGLGVRLSENDAVAAAAAAADDCESRQQRDDHHQVHHPPPPQDKKEAVSDAAVRSANSEDFFEDIVKGGGEFLSGRRDQSDVGRTVSKDIDEGRF